jgi:hypothetical protein
MLNITYLIIKNELIATNLNFFFSKSYVLSSGDNCDYNYDQYKKTKNKKKLGCGYITQHHTE